MHIYIKYIFNKNYNSPLSVGTCQDFCAHNTSPMYFQSHERACAKKKISIGILYFIWVPVKFFYNTEYNFDF